MLTLRKVAVTGGLAAGKTTVCQFFKELGAYVVSADEIVHQLLSPETAVGQQVIRLLGSDIISDNTLNRKKIAAKVFSQPKLLQNLEELIHPAVFDEIDKRYQHAQQQSSSLFIAEIPLLYESEREGKFDFVITVLASEELCRRRFMSQSQRPSDEFDKRMLRQIDPKKKAAKAHFTLFNEGDVEQLKAQVTMLYTQLT